jgi:hypothetical protein
VPSDITERIRARVADCAGYRCEYCLILEADAGFPLQVDHIVSRKHGGSSEIENLAYACILCNRHKGSDVAAIDPMSGAAIRLCHPRRDRWTEHFRLTDGYIEPLTAIGVATVRLLRLNAVERVAERKALGRIDDPFR